MYTVRIGTEAYTYCVVKVNTAGYFILQKDHLEGEIFPKLHYSARCMMADLQDRGYSNSC